MDSLTHATAADAYLNGVRYRITSECSVYCHIRDK